MLERIAAIFSVGWKKWQKQITALLSAAVIVIAGAFLLSATPVQAAPPTAETTTSAETTTGEGTTPEETTPAAAPTTETPPATDTNCNDQLGALGWLVCPTTGSLSKAIDYIYGVLIDFIKINPITTDQSSPTYIIWEYARSITNIVFIIFIVIIVISQVTGFGISNYGLKKSLPRIIIAAILVNLSFIICAIAVDVSNILGFSVHNLFTNITQTVSSSGMDLSGIPTVSWADFTTAILAGAPLIGAAGIAGLAITGGLGGLIWLVAPVVLGALVAIIAALLTLAARQALVTLLVMISPLAIVAYLLPNTEPLFKKWRDLLTKLLVFFPMFSLLFGASQLAGWAIIAGSNGNTLIFILGMAVQIFPLIFTPTLLKMSGTVLGKVNELARRPFAPAQRALTSYADFRRARSRELHRTGQSASASLSRFLYNKRAVLENDLAEAQTINKSRAGIAVARSLDPTRRNLIGQQTRRSRRHLENIASGIESDQYTKHIENAYEKGLDPETFKYDTDKARINRFNNRIVNAADDLRDETAHALHIKLEDLKSYEKRTNEAIAANVLREAGKPHDKAAIARYDKFGKILGNYTEQEREAALNTVVANAIAAKAKARTEITGDYFSLFNEASYTANIDDFLRAALIGRNENSMSAAIQVMMMRGDTDLISNKLSEITPNLIDENSLENRTMWKRISDTLLPYKKDSAILAGYAKCLNMARGKAENARRTNEQIAERNKQRQLGLLDGDIESLERQVPDFFDFEDYIRSDGIAAQFNLDARHMIASNKEALIASDQDRTVWNWQKDRNILLFTDKQRRAGLFTAPNEGEAFDSLIDVHLGKGGKWDDKYARNVLTFEDINALNYARQNIINLVRDNATQQTMNFKTNSLETFSITMSDEYDKDEFERSGKYVFKKDEPTIMDGLAKMATHFRPNIASDFRKKANRGQLDMNPEIRRKLNLVLHFDDPE